MAEGGGGFASRSASWTWATLYGKSADQHDLFAAHVAGSETWTVTQGYGRYVQEWKLQPARPDNHWLDCLVGCAVAASICGIRLPGLDAQAARERKPIRRSALRGGA